MADWQQYLQSVFFGVLFSYLLAKLFSVICASQEESLGITSSHQNEDESKPEFDEKPVNLSARVLEETEPLLRGNEGTVAEKAVTNYLGDSDDGWEGVESTELDEAFSAATTFVASAAAGRASQKVSTRRSCSCMDYIRLLLNSGGPRGGPGGGRDPPKKKKKKFLPTCRSSESLPVCPGAPLPLPESGASRATAPCACALRPRPLPPSALAPCPCCPRPLPRVVTT